MFPIQMIIFRSCLFTALVVLVGASVSCKKAAAPSAPATGATSEVQQQYQHPQASPTPTIQTRYFKGSIGSALDLQMKLLRDGGTLSGNYFYQKVGKKIDLKGTVDSEGNLLLEEFDPGGKSTGVFKGIWKTGEVGLVNIVGNWSKPNSDKRTAFSLHEQPIEFSGTTEVISKAIKETSKKPKYEIDAEYPQIVGAVGTNFDKFNQEARNLVSRKVAEFKKDMAEWSQDQVEATEPSEMGSDLGIGYDIGIARDDLISLEFSIGGYYQGAAHPNSYTQVLNYDLKNGKALKLADLFNPGSKYLQTISTFAMKDLKRQAKTQGADSMLTDESIQSGAGPDLKNYKSWTISKKGLAITFDSYQVAPYAAGPQSVVIPYSALKEIIKTDGPLAGFVK